MPIYTPSLTNQRTQWRLYDVDLSTQIGVIPFDSGSIYFQLNEPGSGKLKVPLDVDIADELTSGRLCVFYYRGDIRGGFFIDNIDKDEIADGEAGARFVTVSGRGAMTLLDDAVVWTDSTGVDQRREFTSKSYGYILDLFLTEAVARGCYDNFTWDFDDTQDSDGNAWSDSQDQSIPVGSKMLDLVRSIATTGTMEFSLSFSSPNWVLSAYKNGVGSDVSGDVFFRVGQNCQEIKPAERGDEIRNSYLVKYRAGYVNPYDSTSITNRRRRETFLNVDNAQSADSALTYSSAKLDTTKDPKASISLKVYDGSAVGYFGNINLFNDYTLGDTVSIDKFGTVTTERILGLQIDCHGDDYVTVVPEVGSILYDRDMKVANDLDLLLTQWASAKDASQMEVKQWLPIGYPNGQVNAMVIIGTTLYFAGAFTSVNGIAAAHVAQYDLSTGAVSATDATGIPSTVINLISVGGTLYATTSTTIYKFAAGSWSSVGVTDSNTINQGAIATDGSNLYIGGNFTGVNSVTSYGVIKYNGTSWSAMATSSTVYGLAWFSGALYASLQTADPKTYVQYYSGGSWNTLFAALDKAFQFVAVTNNNLYFAGYSVGYHDLYEWDGVAGSPTSLGLVTVPIENLAIESYLSDLYLGNITSQDFTAYPNRYSGGYFSQLGTSGLSSYAYALAVYNGDLYAGGGFTTADGKSAPYLAVYVTTFESLTAHLSNQNTQDTTIDDIHNSSAATPADADYFGFLQSATGFNKWFHVTWANVKATLKTYFDTFYAPVAKGVTNGDSHDHNGGDGAQIPAGGISAKSTNPILMHGQNGTLASGATGYLSPVVPGLLSATYRFFALRDVTALNLYVSTNSAQPATGSLVYTLAVEGSDTALTVTVAASSAAGSFSDTSHTVSVNQGDRCILKIVNNATSASAQITAAGFEFKAALE